MAEPCLAQTNRRTGRREEEGPKMSDATGIQMLRMLSLRTGGKLAVPHCRVLTVYCSSELEMIVHVLLYRKDWNSSKDSGCAHFMGALEQDTFRRGF